MTTALDLTEVELSDLKDLTKKADPSAALHQAVVEYIRYAKRMRLKQLSEVMEMQDNWQELEQREMDSQHGKSGTH
jgi:hypothetical protein